MKSVLEHAIYWCKSEMRDPTKKDIPAQNQVKKNRVELPEIYLQNKAVNQNDDMETVYTEMKLKYD